MKPEEKKAELKHQANQATQGAEPQKPAFTMDIPKLNPFSSDEEIRKRQQETKDTLAKGYKPTSKFDKKKKPIRRNIIKIFTDFLEKVGVEENPKGLNNKIIAVSTSLTILISAVIIFLGISNSKEFTTILIFLVMTWTLVYFEIYMLSILAVAFYFDIRLYQRTKQIEEALPDFLQLASANISAGMTIDHALWFAVRPRFGILAKEMEDVAKATIAGEDLQVALQKLADKYPSNVLKQSISLLRAGIEAGGEMAELLNKIASNIQETKLMRKEIAASVMTYVIFIGAATIIAAPILFGLSTELLVVIRKVTSSISIDKSSGLTGFFTFDFSSDSISVENFTTFATLVLLISSFFSAAIISTVRRGNVKEGIRMIPVFMLIALLLYMGATAVFRSMMSGLV